MVMFDIFETGYPLRNLWLLIINYRFFTRGLGSKYRRNFAEFSIEFQELRNFSFRNHELWTGLGFPF